MLYGIKGVTRSFIPVKPVITSKLSALALTLIKPRNPKTVPPTCRKLKTHQQTERGIIAQVKTNLVSKSRMLSYLIKIMY